MTQAYETSLHLSFDVRGGLIMRQMHHWAALLFMAAIVVHMFRVFFTGAFRKPRELNWIIGVAAVLAGLHRGLRRLLAARRRAVRHRPADRLAIMLSIPVVGTWVTTSLFGGEFPGTEILPRLYILHVFLLPGILLALITVHLGLMVKQKHTQWPGPGRTNHNVVGVRMFPGFVAEGRPASSCSSSRVIALHGRPVPDQPDLAVRPVRGVGGLGRQPARLVRHVPRRLDPAHAGLGHLTDRRRLHDPGAVLAHGGAARHPVTCCRWSIRSSRPG